MSLAAGVLQACSRETRSPNFNRAPLAPVFALGALQLDLPREFIKVAVSSNNNNSEMLKALPDAAVLGRRARRQGEGDNGAMRPGNKDLPVRQ